MPPTQSPLATAHRAPKLDTIESITRICYALRAETRPHRGRYLTRFVERIRRIRVQRRSLTRSASIIAVRFPTDRFAQLLEHAPPRLSSARTGRRRPFRRDR